MGLKKILEAYKLSNEFVNLMGVFETENIKYSDLERSIFKTEYAIHEKKSEEVMAQNRCEMIVGVLSFFVRHPKKMINAQKYYHNVFGKPCKI